MDQDQPDSTASEGPTAYDYLHTRCASGPDQPQPATAIHQHFAQQQPRAPLTPTPDYGSDEGQ
jgi:hypothetical protein